MKKQTGWKSRSIEYRKQAFDFSEGYKGFLDAAKTERETARFVEAYLAGKGFDGNIGSPRSVRVYRDKTAMAFVRGKKNPLEGINIIVAHIDAPRLDLKQNPLYEDTEIALLRTHYYGGIKKYQWVAIPLALHGVVARTDGRTIDITIGEAEDDPVLVIDDLLPHLSRKTQEEKKLADAIDAEKLTVLFGSMPLIGEDQGAVKKYVLKLLDEQYGISEDDFVSAELEIVPAFRARDVGIDRSMIGAYGQDDRASAYPLLAAIGEIFEPERSCLAVFSDKEEIGSEGSTGIQSAFLQVFLYDLLEGMGTKPDGVSVTRMLYGSRALSGDVNAALNPTYKDVHEEQNAAYLGRGICISKYTGHGGKVGASDASAEYVAEIRRIFDREEILWQAGEMGKVDQGGGGTVAKFLALYGMDVLDCGAPLLTMHSPFEVSSKLDIYETFRAFRAFFKS
jgi:aspartyl aminopeptidase